MGLLTYSTLLLRKELNLLDKQKVLISTINAYSLVTACRNKNFSHALLNSHILLPDGISIVMAMKILIGEKLKKISGYDLFEWEMQRMEKIRGKVFFLGSNNSTLMEISERCKREYPNVLVQTYSPPYKTVFTKEDSNKMIYAINRCLPDVLFIGMTAPKQEIWAAQHFEILRAKHVCCIGAVFDFYAGTIKRAPRWIIRIGFEWFYRLVREPKRLWKRYLIGNWQFIILILKEKWCIIQEMRK